ncbi:outer membrane beta-barrel protein [Pontibacter roseus]|uniref:outer membrane beta-barrel protein n=1 Tax=Pontibacter roseus TaxID=336989 RepID=UPI00036D35E9|nr:outer membrane beta-barrel protein [Pontibacter roseus]
MHLPLLFLLLFALPSLANARNRHIAQLSDGPAIDSTLLSNRTQEATAQKKVRLGAKAGIGLSNMNFNKGYPKPATPVEGFWGVGAAGGAVIEIMVYKRLYLQQEYLYAHLQGEAKAEGLGYTLGYLSLPVLLKYQVMPKIAVLAGPQFDLLLHAQQDFEGSSLDIMHETEARNIGAAAGIEYSPTSILSIDARVMHGINHIGIKYGNSAQEFKLESVQVSVVLRPFK